MHPLLARANRNVRSLITLNRGTEFAALCRMLELGPRDSLLDVGSGDGYWTARFARRAGQVTALEPDDILMRHASAHNAASNIRYQEGTGESMPFVDASFDKVVSVSSVEHFQNPVKGFEEMFRVLRPGGRLAVSVDSLVPENSSASFRSWHSTRHFVNTYFRQDDLVTTLTRTGFQVDTHATVHLIRSALSRRARETFIRNPRILLPLFPLFRGLVVLGDSFPGPTHGQIIVITARKPNVAHGKVA